MQRSHTVSLTIFALALSATSFADGIGLGLNGSLYSPTSSVVRDALGSQWRSYGLSPGRGGNGSDRDRSFDANFITQRGNGNKLTIISPTFGISKTLGQSESSVIYVAARAGLSYVDYEIGSQSEKYVVPTGNVEVGTILNKNFVLYVRYDYFQKKDGFDFSGASVGARFQIFSF